MGFEIDLKPTHPEEGHGMGCAKMGKPNAASPLGFQQLANFRLRAQTAYNISYGSLFPPLLSDVTRPREAKQRESRCRCHACSPFRDTSKLVKALGVISGAPKPLQAPRYLCASVPPCLRASSQCRSAHAFGIRGHTDRTGTTFARVDPRCRSCFASPMPH